MKIINKSVLIEIDKSTPSRYLEKVQKTILSIEKESKKVIRFYISDIRNSTMILQVTFLDNKKTLF